MFIYLIRMINVKLIIVYVCLLFICRFDYSGLFYFYFLLILLVCICIKYIEIVMYLIFVDVD